MTREHAIAYFGLQASVRYAGSLLMPNPHPFVAPSLR